ncbi:MULTISPECIES: hypothetical protein [unclassified Paenibacillus]|uniref:hypothetical protein n=1 Tax=unclassified Paenibacillus TaxID=185978 RepID=UPI001AE8226F|nr:MULTISPECIES: hypothetical protein [unclassified Paenibacillus]MBP1153729.1 hypothetical protein [Paenibacillus sp. PvP091]MBP1170886.1 hypothetical protein [Paenibacillus sp. PvR098]MBP2441914.1 hypothetical protein [Paenibacillus sp. PvP052]
MGNNVYKVSGMIFMITSGILYTAERIVEKLSAAMVAAGYASGGIGTDRTVNYSHFFENFFVWFFLFIGFILLAYGFPKDRNE